MEDSLVVADALNPGISVDIAKDIDITLVPPLRGEGQPRQFAEVASHETRRRKNGPAPNSFCRRRRLVVLGIETRGQLTEEASLFS